ncbi:MAG TPA: iron ABC transporter permease [Rhodothermales bacterium]|nr:iron ABC transporter permease [Rhodothermales bacterium]
MNRPALVSVGFLAALVISMGVAVAFGSEPVPLADALRILWAHASFSSSGIVTPTDQIIWNLRLPRVILALVVGGGLAVSGVSMQALVRNPLAEPYVLGISSGASAGASLFYMGLLPPLLSKALSMPLAAFLGGLAAISLVYVVARTHNGISIARLLLAGVAISALMAAVTSLITLASPDLNRIRAVLFWLLGSFSGARWSLLPIPAAASLAALFVFWGMSRPLDALLLGEEAAFNLGVPVETVKRVLLVVTALVTGTLVAAAGVIGFVGLIVPHAVRSLTGVPHRRVLPVSFLAGAIFMIWVDLAARTLLPAQELPVGILTAVCGVPFFLYLLRRRAYQFG